MDDELDTPALGDADLEKTTALIGTDQHREITDAEHTDWILIGVQNVFIFDPVVAAAVQDHGIHSIKLS